MPLSKTFYPILSTVSIGVAPIKQATHMRSKNSNIQGWSIYVIKLIFLIIRNAHKGNNLLPLEANYFLLREVPI